MFEKEKEKNQASKRYNKITNWVKTRSFIGFEKVPIYEVAQYFKKAVFNGTLGTRAGSLAFNFFLAIFPGLLFLFSLIPFIPVDNFFNTLIDNLELLLPESVKEPVLTTLHDLIDNEREGFLVFNILLTLYFASNGVDNLMTQFNNTNLFRERRVWWKKRLIAIALTIVLALLAFTAVGLISFSPSILNYLLEIHFIGPTIKWFYLNVLRWLLVVILFYLAISTMYYFGPAKRKKWKFFSAGSTTATILIIISSLGFSYYINHFSQYNAIYGSIGTIIIVMLYFQLNSFLLLLGFELNASIRKGKLEFAKK